MAAAPANNNLNMKINKTEEEYNVKSIRFLLLTITAMFMVIATLMIVIGISVYGYYHDFSYFYESAKSGHFVTPSVLCVFVGLALMVLSMFGFFGSLKQSTCMVNLYAFFLTIILILKLVVVVLALTLGEDKIMSYVYVPFKEYTTDYEIQQEMDMLQAELGCCGGYSYMDYMGADFTSNHSTVVVSKQEVNGDLVTILIPSSCCVTSSDVFCSRVWSTGCKAALVNVLVQNVMVLGVLGVSVMIINLLGIIFALLLARCIRKMKSQKALQMWKIREQMIMAREAEEQMKREQEQPHVYIEQQASSVA